MPMGKFCFHYIQIFVKPCFDRILDSIQAATDYFCTYITIYGGIQQLLCALNAAAEIF